VTVIIHAHSVNRSIDTMITIRAEHRTNPGPIMSLKYDSVYIETRYCQPVRTPIFCANLNCDSLIIDSIIMDPQYPEFIIDTIQNPNKLSLAKYSSIRIP